MNKFSKIKQVFVGVMLLGLLVPNVGHAGLVGCQPQTMLVPGPPPDYNPIEILDEDTECTILDLLSVPATIFNWLVGFAAAVLMLMIVFAGSRMILYHLAESPETELLAAKTTLTRAIWGFVIVITAYVVVWTFVFLLGFDMSGGNSVWTMLDIFF